MSWFNNLALGRKLLLVFSFILISVVGMGGVAVYSLQSVNKSANELRLNWMPSINATRQLQYQVSRLRAWELAHIICPDAACMKEAEQKIDGQKKAIDDLHTTYETLISSNEEHDLYFEYRRHLKEYMTMTADVVRFSAAGQKMDAYNLMSGQARKDFTELIEHLDELVKMNEDGGDKSSKLADKNYNAAFLIISLVVGFVTVFSIFAGLILRSGIAVPLAALEGVMGRLAAHDLTVDIPYADRQEEVGRMAQAVLRFKQAMIDTDRMQAEQEEGRKAREKRAERVQQLTKSFDADATSVLSVVSSSAKDMFDTSETMSAAAEETHRQSEAVTNAATQASGNVQTVSAAAEELSSSIQEISRQVSQAAQVSSEAVRQANDTQEIVGGLEVSVQKSVKWSV